MALKKTVITPQGFVATDAYHRVEGVVLESKTQMSYFIRSYKDNTGVPAFFERKEFCAYDINGENPFAQAYAAAKQLDDFKDAIDC